MRKKIVLLIVTFIIAFTYKLDVKAVVYGSNFGASLHYIIEGINSSDFKISDKDEICLFRSEYEPDNYIVIMFEWSNSSYVITDITPEFSSHYRARYAGTNFFKVDDTFLAKTSSIKQISGNFRGEHWWQPQVNVDYYTYSGNVGSFCKSIRIGRNDSMVILGSKTEEIYGADYMANYVDGNDTRVDKDKLKVADVFTALDAKEGVISSEERDKQSCEIKLDSENPSVTAFLKKDNAFGWYFSYGNNSKICFGEPDGFNSIRLQVNSSDTFPNKFPGACSDYFVSPNLSNDYDCDFWFVSNDYREQVSEEITTESHPAGSKLAVYALYGNSGASSIVIYKTENGIDVEGKSKITDDVTNLSSFVSRFTSGDKSQFPMWINEIMTSDGKAKYQFSETRLDGANNRNYIEVNKIHEIVKLGNDEVYKTCEQLFTNDFLTFINNTFFRILYIGIPILLIVLTTFDFAKVVFNNDKDGMQTAGKRFGKRVIIAILIYLVPTLIIFVSNLMGATEIEDCAKTMQRISEENQEN